MNSHTQMKKSSLKINRKSNHRYFLFDNIEQYTNIAQDELKTYLDNGMSKEAVERKRAEENKKTLETLDI